MYFVIWTMFMVPQQSLGQTADHTFSGQFFIFVQPLQDPPCWNLNLNIKNMTSYAALPPNTIKLLFAPSVLTINTFKLFDEQSLQAEMDAGA